MVDWQNPALRDELGVTNMNIIFLLVGLFGWEYVTTFGVEYAVIRGRLAFRWILIPYILGRMFQFIFLVVLAIRANPPSAGFMCLPTTIFSAIAGNISVGCASTNFMIRAWVIWKDSRLVHALLFMFALGHWTVLTLDTVNLRPTASSGECGVSLAHPTLNVAVFVYTPCYDFLVLVLSIAGLSRGRSKSPLRRQLYAQGLAYFVVAVVTYIPPTVFTFLDVYLMVSMTALTATTAGTIASCRAVRLLLDLRTRDSMRRPSGDDDDNDVPLTSHIMIQSS